MNLGENVREAAKPDQTFDGPLMTSQTTALANDLSVSWGMVHLYAMVHQCEEPGKLLSPCSIIITQQIVYITREKYVPSCDC